MLPTTMLPTAQTLSLGREIQYAEPSDTVSGDPFDWQAAFHNSVALFKGFSGPINSGKSRALCYEALTLGYENPGCLGVIGAPTYPMLRDSTLLAFRQMLDENGVPYRFHKSEYALRLLEPNSHVLFRALDNFERIRGANLAFFGVDELTYCKPESWLRLEGRLRDRKAKRLCGFASWTPKGFDWVYDRFIGPDKKAGYETFLAQQNPLAADFYERLGASYSERFYKQEAQGEYLSVFSGQVYYAFKRETHVFDVPYGPHSPIWWSLDFNVNPMCSVIGQTIKERILVLDELVLPESNTLAACEQFLEHTAKWARGGPLNLYVYGDASGEHRETSASRTDWQIVKNFFSRYTDRYRVQFRVPSSNPPVKDRVNCVNAMLRNYLGQRRMFLHRRCRELAKDLEQLTWKTDRSGNSALNKSDPMRSHLSDALGYYVVHEFPMRGVVGERGGPAIL